MRKRKFLGGKAPLFGTTEKPRSAASLKQSPFYWWIEYLKRNEDYRKTCERRGVGKCRAVYQDFGVSMPSTSVTGGASEIEARSCSESPFGHLTSLGTSGHVEITSDVLVLRIPLSLSKKHIKNRLDQILKKVHGGKRGAPSVSKSTARYRVRARCDVRAMEIALTVFDERKANPTLALWEIGEKVGAITSLSSRLSGGDAPKIRAAKKNALANVTLRYFKRAKAAIKNVGEGRFPDDS